MPLFSTDRQAPGRVKESGGHSARESSEMKGFYGRILMIDLSSETFAVEEIPAPLLERTLGGKGLATALLLRQNPPRVDPFHADNHLIFNTGPVTGSRIWGSCRYGVFTKSPQTGFYAESYSGGRVPEAMDAAGYDAVVFRGKSPRLKVVVVSPEGAAFHQAEDLRGKDTFETEDAVRDRFGREEKGWKSGAVVIGPAGEARVRFSVVENDYWRSAGRTGTGAVMGSKGLKAVLFTGDRRRVLHDPEGIKRFSKQTFTEARENPGMGGYKTMGTPMMVQVLNVAQAFPTRYWSEGTYGQWEKISADALHSRCDVTPHACLKCLLACGRMTTVRDGRHRGLRIEGPEYETIFAFGGLCCIDSIEEIAFLNDLCDRLGLDTISAGNLCAFAIEAARRGRIHESIDYGDVDALAGLLKKMACREGIGDVLARGIRFAAETWGMEDLAVHVKGLEPPGYDPRVLKGMGLAYATSDRGACHMRSTFYKAEFSGMIDPAAVEGKAGLFMDFEDRLTLFDTLILCRFYRDLYPWELLGEIIHGTTGLSPDKGSIRRIASGISDDVRRFNVREGLTRTDDRLPPLFHTRPLPSGHTITEEEMATMLKDYYRLQGWDREGRPPEPDA
jgi:aldehyde:ferredoxin oxidoreductase